MNNYLDKVFADTKTSTLMADEIDVVSFAAFVERYKLALSVEKTAVKAF